MEEVYLEVGVAQTLIYAVSLPHLHLQQVVDQVDSWNGHVTHPQHHPRSTLGSHRWSVCVHPCVCVCVCVLPSGEICFQGLGGYMKAALWIWSLISSSSLKGKVPLRLTYMMTPTDHMSRERL